MADLAEALAAHLCSLDGCEPPCADHQSTAGSALKFLGNAGAVLPPGITIGAVYRVTRDGDDDGYLFTDRREADEQARWGGHCGTPGVVETAWRIRAGGVDARTTWKRADHG